MQRMTSSMTDVCVWLLGVADQACWQCMDLGLRSPDREAIVECYRPPAVLTAGDKSERQAQDRVSVARMPVRFCRILSGVQRTYFWLAENFLAQSTNNQYTAERYCI